MSLVLLPLIIALVIANSSSRGCGFRVDMWGTSSPGDKLTGDLANEPAIVACFVFRREICHPAFSDFCNKIGTNAKYRRASPTSGD
jgi:hypothetical protein